MNPATIYHRPLSEFAFATDGTHYVFRLRTGKGEAQSCRFFYADRAAMAPEVYVQACGRELDVAEIQERCRAAYRATHKIGIHSMKVYIKPEESAAYYVINKETGEIEL